ncbi:MAG: glycosyltransferase [Ignavibacteriaceae bacterium]|nr:glycosyltransferase [Ignavibacteriaceae bacterium]
MKKIKVCHFADHLNGKVDGVFKHILSIVKNTDASLFEHYLCFQGNEYIERKFIAANGKIILLPSITSKYPVHSLIIFYKLMKEYEVDIIHCHFLKPYIVAGFCNIILKKKVIYNYHGLFIDHHFYNVYEKTLYRLSHYIINKLNAVQLALTPSQASKSMLIKETSLFPAITSYYNGGEIKIGADDDEEFIMPYSQFTNFFSIVFVGRIEEQKRIDTAVRIIKHLADDSVDVKLFIIGGGSEEAKIKSLIHNLELDDKIIFLGVIDNPSKCFRYFDLLLLTSDYEGMPFVIWEAMSKGLPIVSSAVEGIVEVVQATECGLLFEKNDISAAVSAIKRIIENPELKKKLGENGKSAINCKYNVNNFGIEMHKIYSQLSNDINPSDLSDTIYGA